MRILFLLTFVVFLLGLGVYGAGSSLPVQMTTIHGIKLPVTQTILWQKIDTVADWPKWNSAIVTALPTSEDAVSLIQLDENNHHLSLKIEKAFRSEPDILRLKAIESDLPYELQWEISLIDKTTAEEGKEITQIQPETFIKIVETTRTSNPFMRFIMHYMIGYETLVTTYLNNLARHVGVDGIEIKELVA